VKLFLAPAFFKAVRSPVLRFSSSAALTARFDAENRFLILANRNLFDRYRQLPRFGAPMTTQIRSSDVSATLRVRWLSLVCASWLLFGSLPTASAQDSSLGIRMVPVTITVPELQLRAPLGSTNALEVSTNLTAWQDLTTLVFTSTNLTWVDLFPRGGAYYRLRRVTGGGGPPFPPPLTNLVWIPAGQFVMGSPETDEDADGDEAPQTTVTLTKGFFIGKYEVTQAEYLAVVGSNPSAFTGDPNLPVDSVSWQAATNFCRLFNLQEAGANRLPAGYAYRLPTEAEWEYAARAGSANRFNWGNDFNYLVLTNYAWYSENSGSSTHPVGEKLPNSWGLYDVSGNVCEWCLDSFVFYPGGEVVDPAPSMASANKVFRGGSHGDAAASCRPADRRDIALTTALDIFGFRIVLAQTNP
jgi:formylglycine-generating enzyme required for sulfatase activity